MGTKHDDEQVLKYWERDDVESMYDKHLLAAEISLIRKHIPCDTKVLDAGCGEGEATLVYSAIDGVTVHAVDFSETRLRKARERLQGRENVYLKRVDFLGEYTLDNDFDVVISQRFLINLMEWSKQQKVILGLVGMLKTGGKLILLEGSQQGLDLLNDFRAAWGMEPISPKWHNLFLDDNFLLSFLRQNGCRLTVADGLGSYFLLTRGIRPVLDTDLTWDHNFNRLAASLKTRELLAIDETRFSRLKLWVFQK